MEITFTSSAGSFSADGGTGGSPLKIRSCEGLGLPTKNRTVVKYFGRHGQSCTSFVYDARTVTIGLDLLLRGDEAREFEREMRAIMAEDGVLTVGARAIDACVTSFSPTQICEGNYPRYAVQLTCDYPLFRDAAATTALYERVKLINADGGGKFALPMVFSTRTAGASVINAGDLAVEPVIYVSTAALDDTDEAAAQEVEGGERVLTVTNETNGAVLTLDLSGLEPLPTLVTIDIPNRRVRGDGENLTDRLADNVFMSDFVLETGENKISALWNSTEALFATLEFCCEYLEARI